MKLFWLFGLFALGLLFPAMGFEWDKAKELSPGILWIRKEVKDPRMMKLNIFRLDLVKPGFTFRVTGKDPDYGKKMPDDPDGKFVIRSLRETTVDFMKNARKKGMKMVVAANAAAWSPWKAPWTHKYADTLGLHISDGILVSTRRAGSYPTFYVDDKGEPHIGSRIPAENYSRIRHAVSGFGYVLKDGKITAKQPVPGKKVYLAPRTSFGLSRDKRYFYILVVDGRDPLWSLGADMYDLGKMMLSAGAYTALNMDGGGSSSLVYWDEKKMSPCFVNRHRLGIHRKVGANLGILAK